ncbi:MAG: hypothetical protein IT444_11380 [Phycisphaeraceae bacterium]|nr:hypothetical protein [Phycisphaeraceae bacterium]
MFSTDRDLLAYEPSVFADAASVALERCRANDGIISGTTLSSAASDFAAQGVEPSCVVVAADVPLEVISRTDAHTLVVSKLRPNRADTPTPPTAGMGLEIIVRSFAPQAALVHDALLLMLGIDPDESDGMINKDMIVSLSVMARLETLGTLERIYTGAVALTGDNGELWKKASEYHRRFGTACRSARIRLDLDGDGRADFTRELGVLRFCRR